MTGRGSSFAHGCNSQLQHGTTTSNMPFTFGFKAKLFKDNSFYNPIAVLASDDEDDDATIEPLTYTVPVQVNEYQDTIPFEAVEVRSSTWYPTFRVCPDSIALAELRRIQQHYGTTVYNQMINAHGRCYGCDSPMQLGNYDELSNQDGYELKYDPLHNAVAHVRYPFEEDSFTRERLLPFATNGRPWSVRTVFSSSLAQPYLLTDPITHQEYIVYE